MHRIKMIEDIQVVKESRVRNRREDSSAGDDDIDGKIIQGASLRGRHPPAKLAQM